MQKVDKHSRNSHELKFSMKSLILSCLICAVNLYLLKSYSERQNLLEVARAAKSFLQTSKVCQNLPITIRKGLVGARESLKGRGKMARRKVKNGVYEGISMTKFNNLKVKRVKSNLKYTESKLVKEGPR